ncbi:MAG: Iron-sulfur cluster carrier protein [Holosporales bacterium]
MNFKLPLKNVKRTVAIASGKGGVGKSTTALNLAFALQSLNYKVGILDADIYGPSLPTLLNLYEQPAHIEKDGKKYIIPLFYKGLSVLSIGFLVKSEEAIIWRGPMVQQVIKQFLNDVLWGYHQDLDFLIIDLPPGTGDVQLTLLQKLLLDGGVVVSTPQDLALVDAKRGYYMLKKMEAPTLGFILNMSHFVCPNCDECSKIFGPSRLKDFAKEEHVPYLGEIPIDMDLQKSCDEGAPFVLNNSSHAISSLYLDIAQKLKDQLNVI